RGLPHARGRRRRHRARARGAPLARARRARRDAPGDGRARALPVDPRALRPAGDHADGARRRGRPHRRPRARGGRLRDERELAARVRTVLRRAAPREMSPERLVFDDLAIDSATREVTRGERALRLTAKEFDLLWFLASHPRRVFSRDQLMASVWGYEAALD